jgi:hypothetical protein
MSEQFEDAYYDDEIIEQAPKKNKFLSILLSLTLAFTGGLIFKTTLAANVSLGSGAKEFGQGVQVHASCAGSTPLTLKTQTSFANASGAAGKFQLTAISLSNIPTTCYGKAIEIKAYADTATAPLALFNSTVDKVTVYNGNGTFWVTNASSGYDIVTNSTSSFTVTFSSPVLTSGSTAKFTVESMVNTATLNCLQAGNCAVGSTNGPGGGIVFYYSASPFTSVGSTCNTNCHYLEMAPYGWNGGGDDPNIPLSQNTTTYLNTTGGGIGDGLSNTVSWANIAGGGNASNSSAILALQYAGTDNSAGQWFVPSIGELDKLLDVYINQSIGNLRYNYWYASSTEYSATHLWIQLSQIPGKPTYQSGKADPRIVRLVRAF